MLFTHRFGSVETLSRAQYWLTHHGFEVVPPADPAHDVARLTLNVEFSKTSAALALIDSIENADPRGWPSNTTPSRSLHAHSAHEPNPHQGEHARKAGTPIHWHSGEEASPADPVSSKIREYMFSRWE
jgi:hypothetical protein